MSNEKQILEHIKEYLQNKIDTGYNKIFYNDLLHDEKTIDCINAIDTTLEENEQLHSIIKRVREYIMTELITEWDIKNNGYVSGSDLPVDAITPILEILDKENK